LILGFLSDAHGNREGFELGVSLLRSEGAEAIHFLGDAVGYIPGDAVIDAIRATSTLPILGNHDADLLTRNFGRRRNRITLLRETRQTASPSNLEFMASWPDHRYIDSPAGTLLLVHGTPDNPLGGYLNADADFGEFTSIEADFVFVGQTHRPFVRRGERTTFVNVGSCGLPRDCGHMGAACLFDASTGDAEILRFDITEATQAALQRCGPVSQEVLAVFARRSEDCTGA
jgi:predicted phosphodiesterase